jgi:hypothetical protein
VKGERWLVRCACVSQLYSVCPKGGRPLAESLRGAWSTHPTGPTGPTCPTCSSCSERCKWAKWAQWDWPGEPSGSSGPSGPSGLSGAQLDPGAKKANWGKRANWATWASGSGTSRQLSQEAPRHMTKLIKQGQGPSRDWRAGSAQSFAQLRDWRAAHGQV